MKTADAIVMTPDIDLYVPYVEAVFGAATGGMRIPSSIFFLQESTLPLLRTEAHASVCR